MKKQTERRGWFIRMISPLMLALIIFSCNDDVLENPISEPPDISSKKNPFTVENVAQAFENLVSLTNPNGRVNFVAPSPGAGRAAVVEAWGYFIGPTFNRLKYTAFTSSLAVNIREADLRRLENQIRDDSTPYGFDGTYSYGWIPAGFLHDCVDAGELPTTGIIDQVNGYTINGIFKGFDSGSTTIQSLKNAILTNNGNSQATQVNNLVTSYGW